MSCICIIPARGGSKRIPGKNIKGFCGKPIIAYSIEAALSSKLFDEIMVSTDSGKIAAIAKKYGASVPFLRSNEKSNDFAGITEVLLEVLAQYELIGKTYDSICCLLPTAPFVTPYKLVRANELLSLGKYNCIFPVVEYSYPVQRSLRFENGFLSMRWPENLEKRSQDLESSFHDSGQFYFIETTALINEKKIFTKRAGGIVFEDLEVQDIDTDTDWKLAELKYTFQNSGL